MKNKKQPETTDQSYGFYVEDDSLSPTKANPTDLGWDLVVKEDTFIPANQAVIVKTGVFLKMPPGWAALVSDRSSSFLKRGLLIHQGWIDETYNKEVGILVRSLDKIETHQIITDLTVETLYGQWVRKGERIAQVTFIQVPETNFMSTKLESKPESERGGYGSTGK